MTLEQVEHLASFPTIGDPCIQRAKARPINISRSCNGDTERIGSNDEPSKNQDSPISYMRSQTLHKEASESPASYNTYGRGDM